jgi:hypothetical protein
MSSNNLMTNDFTHEFKFRYNPDLPKRCSSFFIPMIDLHLHYNYLSF